MTRRLEVMRLDSLKLHPKNPKKHDERLIGASFKRFGFVEPVTLDERTGFVISGNGRVGKLIAMKAAGEASPDDVEVLGPDGEWGVLVNRGWSSRDDTEAEAFLIAANEIGIKGGWHEGKLDELLLSITAGGANVEQLVATGYGKTDMERILAKLQPDADDDDFEPAPLSPTGPPPWVKDGALYQLGAHRVFVGDSLVAENRARLLGEKPVDMVAADPPYAIYGSSSGVSENVADDKMVLPFFEAYFRAVAEHLKEFGHSYTWCDWRSWASLVMALRRVPGLALKNGLTWDKGGSGLGPNYANTTEWVLFAHRLEPKKAMKSVTERTGIRAVNRPNIFRENRPHGEERLHNAAKPVSEIRKWVSSSTDAGARVWDPFSGSGSVLIACEREGRVCLAGEMDLRNAQITIERWQKVTGQKAVEVK